MASGRWLMMGWLFVCAVVLAGCSESGAPSGTGGATGGSGSSGGADGQADDAVLDVTIRGETFTLELALDDDARLQGLSDRESIDEHGGMLFVFPDEKRREFVMRRCLVPIDIAFLNSEGKIVWMHAMQVESDPDMPEYRLKRYDSHYPSRFAIEFRDGTLRRLGLKQDEAIDLPLEALKDRAR